MEGPRWEAAAYATDFLPSLLLLMLQSLLGARPFSSTHTGAHRLFSPFSSKESWTDDDDDDDDI